MLASALLTGCGANLADGNAGQARAQVEAALAQAQAFGVSPATIATLQATERHIDSERGWLGIDDTTATRRYQSLIQTIAGAENTALSSAQSAVAHDQATLTTQIRHNVDQGITSSLYQLWQQADQRQLGVAATPRDFRRIDGTLQIQLTTLQTLTTAYGALKQLGDTIAGLRGAGIPTALPQAEYAQGQSQFGAATTTADFTALLDLLDAEQIGLINDQAQAIPYVGQALLDSYQQRVNLAQNFGEDVKSFQTDLASDTHTLIRIDTVVQYQSFQQQVARQMDGLALPLIRGQARHDIGVMQSLLTYCYDHQIMDYEYTSAFGIGGVEQDFLQALTLQDFQDVDDETNILIENLRTMITNLADTTPHDQPHAADRDLMRYYGIGGEKVLVVSLREQSARAYDNGQLVMSTYVTTGRTERPSPPGLWHVSDRETGITFYSADQPGSEFWFPPTYVNYALLYHDGGFYVHDAWWRTEFGPGTNLPHNDPHAFDNGSHGCVNVPEQQMALIYAWADIGMPVIVY